MHRFFRVVAFSLILFCMPGISSMARGQDPGASLVLPEMDGQRVRSRRPVITVPIPPGAATLRLTLDDVDVSTLATITDSTVTYTPEFDLDYGSHTVMVEALDQDGQPLPDARWQFFIPQSDTWDRASASFQLDTNLVGKLGEHPGNSSPDWQVQTSGTLSSELEKENSGSPSTPTAGSLTTATTTGARTNSASIPTC